MIMLHTSSDFLGSTCEITHSISSTVILQTKAQGTLMQINIEMYVKLQFHLTTSTTKLHLIILTRTFEFISIPTKCQ